MIAHSQSQRRRRDVSSPYPARWRPFAVALVLSVGVQAPLAAFAADGRLETPALRKAALKCQKLVAQVTTKLVASKLKAIDACGNAALACVQTKQADGAACGAAAGQSCAKKLDAATSALVKAYAKIVRAKSCATDLRTPDLLSLDGLGFGEIAGRCQTDFAIDVCGGLPPLAECLVLSHQRAAGVVYGPARPRTAELLGLLPTPNLLPIDGLPTFSGCGTCPTTSGNPKAVEKCGKALSKSTQALLGALEKRFSACVQRALGCAQAPSADPTCFARAAASCNADAVVSGVEATKFAAAVTKACGPKSKLAFGELADPSGLNLVALNEACTELVGLPVTSTESLSSCLQQRAACTAADLIQQSVPRTRAFGAAGSLGALTSQLTTTCPAASIASTAVSGRERVVFGSLVKFFKGIRLRNNGAPGIRVNGGAPGVSPGAGRRITFGGAPSRAVFGGITKIPFTLLRRRGREAPAAPRTTVDAPILIVTIQRDDLAFEDHFEVPLDPAAGELEDVSDELEITYQDALPACAFTLAVTARVDGVVGDYAPLPQVADPGTAPTISDGAISLVELNSGFCSGTNGSLFRVTFNYADTAGAVLPTSTSIGTTLHFEPSNAETSFTAPPVELTGDGFTGTAAIELCAAFNLDTDLEVTVVLNHFGGASNPLKVTTPRPPGAN